jgi:uracil-DNA glycosylase
MDAHRQRYLDLMGIVSWRDRAIAQATPTGDLSATYADVLPAPPPTMAPIANAPLVNAPVPVDCSGELRVLADTVSECTRCPLAESRTRTVFGVGNHAARLMVIGEAPGADEDRQGEPFVGRAGQLLDAMLRAISIAREDAYIVNILKCRPPRNRDPAPEEVVQCSPYLHRQIELVKPQVLLAVGRIAAQTLLNTSTAIGRLREQTHEYADLPLLVTYHPAYLLRTPAEKRKAWDDLKRVRAKLELG